MIARFLGSRPVYVIRANNRDLALVLALYDLQPLGGAPVTKVYRVLGPRADLAMTLEPGSRRSRTSFRLTTRKRTSGPRRGGTRRPAQPWRTSSRSSSSTTGRGTPPRPSPTNSRPRIPGVRVIHHEHNRGYGARPPVGIRAARLRSHGVHRRRPPVPASRTSAGSSGRYRQGDADAVVGFRIKRADPLVRTLYARAYRLANRIFFGLRVTDVDCACKLFRRDALDGIGGRVRGAPSSQRSS